MEGVDAPDETACLGAETLVLGRGKWQEDIEALEAAAAAAEAAQAAEWH